MRHQMCVTLKSGDGLLSEIVCVDHELDECGVREAFFWDPVASLEGFEGEPIQLAQLEIGVLGTSEDKGFEWQVAVASCVRCGSTEHSLSGHRFDRESQDSRSEGVSS